MKILLKDGPDMAGKYRYLVEIDKERNMWLKFSKETTEEEILAEAEKFITKEASFKSYQEAVLRGE